MLHAMLVGNATDDLDLEPIEEFKVGNSVVFISDTRVPWRIWKIDGNKLSLEYWATNGQRVTTQVFANDVTRTSRLVPFYPKTPTVVTLPTPAAAAPSSGPATSTYVLIGVGVLALLGLGIAAARRLNR